MFRKYVAKKRYTLIPLFPARVPELFGVAEAEIVTLA